MLDPRHAPGPVEWEDVGCARLLQNNRTLFLLKILLKNFVVKKAAARREGYHAARRREKNSSVCSADNAQQRLLFPFLCGRRHIHRAGASALTGSAL
jgi:hypothetical protein